MLWALCYKFVQTPITYSVSEEIYNYYLKFILFRWPTRSHSPLQPMGGATLMPTWIPLATEMLYMEATQQKHSLHTQYATLIYILLQTRVIPSGFDAWAKQASSSYSVDFSLYFPRTWRWRLSANRMHKFDLRSVHPSGRVTGMVKIPPNCKYLTAYIVTYSDSGFHQDLSRKKMTFI